MRRFQKNRKTKRRHLKNLSTELFAFKIFTVVAPEGKRDKRGWNNVCLKSSATRNLFF